MSRLDVVIINGFPRSGKDSFVSMCQMLRPGRVVNYSSISPVYGLAEKMGFDVSVKDERTRTFLSELGRAAEKFKNFITSHCVDQIIVNAKIVKADDSRILFIHIREPTQILKVISTFNTLKSCIQPHGVDLSFVDITTLIVNRPDSLRTVNNASDQEVENYQYTHRIENNGTLEALKEKAANFMVKLNKA